MFPDCSFPDGHVSYSVDVVGVSCEIFAISFAITKSHVGDVFVLFSFAGRVVCTTIGVFSFEGVDRAST